MRKAVIGLAILSVVLLGILFAFDKALKAETASSDPEVIKKLDDISKSQKEILQGIESLQKELYVVKIRVTQQQ